MKKILILWRNSILCNDRMKTRYFLYISLVLIGFASCRGNGNEGSGQDTKQADSVKANTLDKADRFKDSIIPEKKEK